MQFSVCRTFFWITRRDQRENIIFEILETDFIEDFSIVENFTKEVRKFGCKIAIDDFGSGFSSMENILKDSPFKISFSFWCSNICLILLNRFSSFFESIIT